MVLYQGRKEQKQHITGGGGGLNFERVSRTEVTSCGLADGMLKSKNFLSPPHSLSPHTHKAVSSRNLHNAITISDFAKTAKKQGGLVKRKRLML